jgi:hypothetical protein
MEGTPIAGWIISWKIRKNDNNWGYPHDLGNLHILPQKARYDLYNVDPPSYKLVYKPHYLYVS